jgi:hypothetical protein
MSVVFDSLANNALQRSNAWTMKTNALAAEPERLYASVLQPRRLRYNYNVSILCSWASSASRETRRRPVPTRASTVSLLRRRKASFPTRTVSFLTTRSIPRTSRGSC